MPVASAAPENLELLAPSDRFALSAEAVPDDDALLMLDAARGSEVAFATIVRSHQQSLVNFFTRMGARSDCEDLVQETFVRLFRYRQQYRPAARFTTFLYHLARNVWADRGRKIIRFERLTTEYANERRMAGSGTTPRTGESVDVERALERLSPKLREVIVLNIYQGLRYQEVANVLEIPLGTVKSRINHALAALKEILDER
ncbi:MAG TPA: RNA polymerase sigma factor [Chthoniobacteraceae bacterium]|nr:RNA polymerase sigma factor [Chthoniobacteraceae bacterium]